MKIILLIQAFVFLSFGCTHNKVGKSKNSYRNEQELEVDDIALPLPRTKFKDVEHISQPVSILQTSDLEATIDKDGMLVARDKKTLKLRYMRKDVKKCLVINDCLYCMFDHGVGKIHASGSILKLYRHDGIYDFASTMKSLVVLVVASDGVMVDKLSLNLSIIGHFRVKRNFNKISASIDDTFYILDSNEESCVFSVKKRLLTTCIPTKIKAFCPHSSIFFWIGPKMKLHKPLDWITLKKIKSETRLTKLGLYKRIYVYSIRNAKITQKLFGFLEGQFPSKRIYVSKNCKFIGYLDSSDKRMLYTLNVNTGRESSFFLGTYSLVRNGFNFEDNIVYVAKGKHAYIYSLLQRKVIKTITKAKD